MRIGSSLDNNVKCVEDPGVKCDENAKQLGRTGGEKRGMGAQAVFSEVVEKWSLHQDHWD